MGGVQICFINELNEIDFRTNAQGGMHSGDRMKKVTGLQLALATVLSVGTAHAQSIKAADRGEVPIPAIQDWSSRSVVYGKPMLPDEFDAQGRNGEMQHRYRDPRYVAAVLRRIESELPRLPIRPNSKGSVATATNDRRRGHGGKDPAPSEEGSGSLMRDWSNVLGGGTNGLGGRGVDGVFPAKYTFDITAAPSCTNDFVVYPTNAAGAQSSGDEETYVSTFNGDPEQGTNRTVTVGVSAPRQVVLVSHASDNSGKNFRTAAVDDATRALNLRNAVNRWTHQTGFRAESLGSNITIYSVTRGNVPDDAVSETLVNFNGGSSWPGVNGTGSAGQATIVAFNELYQGAGASTPSGPCNGAWNESGTTKAPRVSWAYNTGNGYITETSPTLSYYDDGKQVAFVQRNGNALQLVLLKWKDGEGTPSVPTLPPAAATAANYRDNTGNCNATSSCMFVIGFSGTANINSSITYSSPYVDYANDTLWVGDGNGRLHKFTGVFQGSPAEVGGNFPAQIIAGANNGIKLSSPVEFDGEVYIGSQSGGAGVGGKLHRINATTGAVASSVKLANNNTTGIREAIIATYAPTASGGSIYAFLFNDGTAGDGSTCVPTTNADACRVIARFQPGFADEGAPLQRAYVGRGNNLNSALYAGAFDDAYYTSPNGSGAMYIVGGSVADTFVPTLWRIPLTNGVMGTPVAGPAVGPKTCNTNACYTALWNWSPVTAIKNGDNEYIYFSMPSNGGLAGCTGACVYMFNLADLNGPAAGTGAAWGTDSAPSAALSAPGGTGGIVVDNTSPGTGASQIYFSQLGTGGNAIQASQSGLE